MVIFNFFFLYFFLVKLTIKNELYLQKLQYVTTSGKAGVEPRVLQTDEGRCYNRPSCLSQPVSYYSATTISKRYEPHNKQYNEGACKWYWQMEELGH